MVYLTRSSLESLAEHEQLNLVVDRKHTSTSDTTEDISASTLKQRPNTLSGNDLATGIEGRLVLDGLMTLSVNTSLGRKFAIVTHFTGSHHHTSTDSIERVRADTSTSGDSPAEQEGGQEVTLKDTDEENRLEGVVHSEVQTTVDDDTSDRGTETAVETKDTVTGESLLVDIHQTVELTVPTTLCTLGVVR